MNFHIYSFIGTDNSSFNGLKFNKTELNRFRGFPKSFINIQQHFNVLQKIVLFN